jgi:hypothetical protein
MMREFHVAEGTSCRLDALHDFADHIPSLRTEIADGATNVRARLA